MINFRWVRVDDFIRQNHAFPTQCCNRFYTTIGTQLPFFTSCLWWGCLGVNNINFFLSLNNHALSIIRSKIDTWRKVGGKKILFRSITDNFSLWNDVKNSWSFIILRSNSLSVETIKDFLEIDSLHTLAIVFWGYKNMFNIPRMWTKLSKLITNMKILENNNYLE